MAASRRAQAVVIGCSGCSALPGCHHSLLHASDAAIAHVHCRSNHYTADRMDRSLSRSHRRGNAFASK